jgi:hypothetical protein
MELTSSNSTFQLEKLNNHTYSLRTNRIFDREEQSSYSFSLITYDHGISFSHSITNQFYLYLIDINDCYPIFDSKINYSFYINENNQENFLLQTIRVFDLDQNDQITLHLEFPNNNTNHHFDLNQQNQLIIKTSLDYEAQSSYHFTLIAEDLVGHRTSIPVNIYLKDLNDNPVRFRNNFIQLKLQENLPIGTHFGLIYAEDKDRNNQIIYRIHSDDFNSTKNLIELNINGSLYTKQRFHRNKINRFQFRIIANDSLHIDTILSEIFIDKSSILITQSPYCLIGYQNESIQFESKQENVLFTIRNPSSSDLILFPNGTMIIQSNLNKYSFDIYLQNNENSFLIFENFLLLNQFQCQTNHIFIQFNQQIIFIGLLCFIILIMIVCYYFQQSTSKKYLDKKVNLMPSFSSLFSPPSPQFTAMTIISSSINRQTNQSSSLSNSSSSTYIKMSRSFDDEII